MKKRTTAIVATLALFIVAGTFALTAIGPLEIPRSDPHGIPAADPLTIPRNDPHSITNGSGSVSGVSPERPPQRLLRFRPSDARDPEKRSPLNSPSETSFPFPLLLFLSRSALNQSPPAESVSTIAMSFDASLVSATSTSLWRFLCPPSDARRSASSRSVLASMRSPFST